ncbi:unnamed protein product [Camellia sinensis]
MELGNFRPEAHVAQQSRRDKLRVQQSSQAQHLEDYPNNLEQLSVHHGLNPDLIRVSNLRYGNISYNPVMFSPEMLNFAVNSQEQPANRPVKVSDEPQNCGTWKSISSQQQSCDWIANYSSGLTGSESNQNNISSSPYLKPSFNGYQGVQPSLTNPSGEVCSQNSQKRYDEMHFNSPPIYQNAPLTVDNGARGSWTDGGNELVLLPTYGNESNPVRLNDASAWIGRLDEEGCRQWSGELSFLANNSSRDLRTVATSDSNTQGLSLSLSTKTLPNQFGEELHSGTGVFNDHHDSKTLESDYLCPNSKPSIGSKVLGNDCQGMVGSSSTFTHRNTGPLGPFTGYATILKGSKFLKPAQLLLDEICSTVMASKSIEMCEVSDDKVSDGVKGSIDAVNASESMVGAKGGGDSGVSSTTFYYSNEISGDTGVRSSSGEYRPEYQQKKAKLLFMQEEICRRYKQYHQQMEMVVSSFDTVAGLSVAAPYISFVLKTVSRHFRCLKNAISDQLKHIRKALGEDFSSPTIGTASSSKGDTSTSRLTNMDHGFTKPKTGGPNLGFLEAQQHIWRPQRGLPERAVSVLRAWLFEHFLHPYPTDTDKHMLASQTGLSRNQVSNWFINARVRVWKPMVEEIHMLETKGLAEPNSNLGKIDGEPNAENDHQPANKVSETAMSSKQVQCLQIGSLAGTGDEHGHRQNTEQWNQEKRFRAEQCQIPASMDGSFVGFVPYQRGGLEIGGLGAVSLTLGLRQSAEQLEQEEIQIRQHFGGQMIHDFVG